MRQHDLRWKFAAPPPEPHGALYFGAVPAFSGPRWPLTPEPWLDLPHPRPHSGTCAAS